MSALKYWVWLSGVRGLSVRTQMALLACFGTAENIYYAEKGELAVSGALLENQLSLLDSKDLSAADKILGDCQKLGIRVITAADTEYPNLLKNTFTPPSVLYVKGSWPFFDDEMTVSIVGTRSATPYGIQCAETLGYDFAKAGAVVISGLARGCDTAAQRGALRAGGFVAGVLGCGIDVVYPKENKFLYEDIAARGVLISEYPPGTPVNGKHFPARNRLISGLSLATIVAEADYDSGAMITAQLALEQGREVFAVPGPLGAEYSKGCNRLIQDGAGLITECWDVLCGYKERFPNKLKRDNDVTQKPMENIVNSFTPAEESTKTFDNTIKIEYIDIKNNEKDLTDDQIKILKTLTDVPAYADDIADKTEIPIRRVLSALTVLEIENLVTQDSGNRFSLSAVITQ